MQDTDFFSWRRTMLLRFQRMEAAEEVYHEIELQAQQLEYDYYSLCVRHPVPFTRPKVAFYTNYPEAWVSYYQAKNFLAIDPVLNPENFSQGHLMWNDDLFSEAQPLWEAARAHGLRRGVTQYLMLPNRALGFLSFSRCSTREIPILSDELQLKMQLLVRESLMALMRLNDEIVMTPEMNFSKREKEILKWTAEGKTSAEIAMILSISENTVNFHQKNMQKKINAPNKTQVACYAAATGLILSLFFLRARCKNRLKGTLSAGFILLTVGLFNLLNRFGKYCSLGFVFDQRKLFFHL